MFDHGEVSTASPCPLAPLVNKLPQWRDDRDGFYGISLTQAELNDILLINEEEFMQHLLETRTQEINVFFISFKPFMEGPFIL